MQHLLMKALLLLELDWKLLLLDELELLRMQLLFIKLNLGVLHAVLKEKMVL
jgi:hypothetical protein